jgi:cysteine synthase
LAAAAISGWRAVEPAAVIEPVWQLMVAAGDPAGAVVAADVSAAVGVAAGVSVGAVVAAADEHAETMIVAAMAIALKRRIPFSNSVTPLPLG